VPSPPESEPGAAQPNRKCEKFWTLSVAFVLRAEIAEADHLPIQSHGAQGAAPVLTLRRIISAEVPGGGGGGGSMPTKPWWCPLAST
jgi:hypothetical protein